MPVFRLSVTSLEDRKESWPRGPGIDLPPGRGLLMTLFCSKYLWSAPSLLKTVTGKADYL
jgi:hypothetical protein